MMWKTRCASDRPKTGRLKSDGGAPPLTMVASRVGGNTSNVQYFAVFLIGVFLGSTIRIAAFLFPDRIVRKLEEVLLDEPVL